MNFLDANGIVLNYRHVPAAEGQTTIAFINSLGTDYRIWDHVAERLEGKAGLLFHDKRGHGLSGLGEPPYSIADHAADLRALLDHVELGPVTLCGLSVGGLIAQQLYAEQPERVSGLVLCDTGAKIGDDALWNDRIGAVREHGLEGFADSIMERWFTDAFRARETAQLAGYRTMVARMSDEGYLGTCAALRDADLREAATRISVPTLCIVGDQDLSTPPEMMRALAGSIPGARFETVTDAGHLPCIEQPDAVARLLSDFIG